MLCLFLLLNLYKGRFTLTKFILLPASFLKQILHDKFVTSKPLRITQDDPPLLFARRLAVGSLIGV